MRVHLVPLALLAALGVVTLAPGTASAQSNRTFYRPNYYIPSNYGTPNASLYRPSNFGSPRVSYGMPNPGRYAPSQFGLPSGTSTTAIDYGALNAGTPVPINEVSSLPSTPPPGSALSPTAVAPAPVAVALPPGNYVVPAAAPILNNSEPPPAGTPAPGEPVAPAAVPSNYGAITGSQFVTPPPANAVYSRGFLPGRYTPPAYGALYSGPQYQSSFYAPLRRVYVTPGQ